MLESIRKAVAIPRLPVELLSCAGVVAGFGMLLMQDLIQPIAIYLLQLYLLF